MTDTETVTQFATPGGDTRRDRWGRPYIVPPDGGKEVAYTRATTVAKTLDDLYGLMGWKQRQTAVGLAQREDLLLAVRASDGDRTVLDEVVGQAMTAAESSKGAITGTAIHALTEKLDRGEELPDGLDDNTVSMLGAYRRIVEEHRLKPVHIEALTVNDEHRIAGTPDRIWRHPDGWLTIGDLKTGRDLSYSSGTIAQQLAIYANSSLYEPATGHRHPHGADTKTAHVIHLPAERPGEASLYRVNIEAGWAAVVELSLRTRRYRKVSPQLMTKE